MNNRRFSLFCLDEAGHGTTAFPHFDPNTYSRFKHGCRHSTRKLACLLANLVRSETAGTGRITIASSAYKSVPTAAALLLDEMLEHFLPANKFRRTRLTRDHIFPFDYARLNPEQRDQAMQDIRLSFEPKDVTGQPLVVIDDAYVTGAHERTIREHLRSLPSQVIYFYLVDMSRRAFAFTEEHMNHAEISTLSDILLLMKEDEYHINSRVLKTILAAPWPEFCKFQSHLSETQQDTLFRLAMSEDYHQFPGFREKLDALNHVQGTPVYRQAMG